MSIINNASETESCATCALSRTRRIGNALTQSRVCALHPPVMVQAMGPTGPGMTTMQTPVQEDDWCSHYKRHTS